MTASTGITASGTAVLLSGGLDSVAALHWALARAGGDTKAVRAIGFDYGQPNRDAELTAAGAIATRLGIQYRVLAIADALVTERKTGLLAGVPDHDPAAQGIHRAFVVGRNLVFLTIAAAHACSWFPVGNVELVVGCNADDRMFPDCDTRTLSTLSLALRTGCARQLQIVAPFAVWTKEQIVAQASEAARADIATSWSCYRGDGPCGRCSPCVLRAAAFAHAGLEDRCAPPKMTGGDPAREHG